jgi:hypothetical protein
MTKLSDSVWNFVDGEMPTLKNVYSPNEIDLLGAQLRYDFTEYYEGDQKVDEGQGIRFGATLNHFGKYFDGENLKEGYSFGILIAKARDLGDAELTAENAAVNAAKSVQVMDDNLRFTAYVVGLDANEYETVYVARAYICDADGVIFYSEAISRSVLTLAENMDGTITDGSFHQN